MKIFRSRGLIAAVVVGALSCVGVLPAAAATTSRDTTVVPAPSRVLLRMKTPTVVLGVASSFGVTVIPRAPGRVVQLTQRVDGQWKPIAQHLTNARGATHFVVTFATAGRLRLRVTAAADANFQLATSASVLQTVNAPPPPYAGAPSLSEGMIGPRVLSLQQRLTDLGYWVGTPNGNFGDATIQAVWALQKAAGLSPSGVVGTTTVAALIAGVVPTPRTTKGYAIEANLKSDLVMFVRNGKVQYTLNTSSGGGYTYKQSGATYQAITPTGKFAIYRTVDGLVTDVLGKLWRPRFFSEGFAIHGDTYVPPYPESHGCVRVSNEAINWIWAKNLAPIGTEVLVYK